jgi:toxin FitB
MTYLVDANVLSEPTKPVPSSKVIDWLTANEGNLAVDSVIVGELCVGIFSLPHGRKRRQLEQWFEDVLQTVDCLPWDFTISRRWAKLVVDVKRKGDTLSLLDSMIAATALQHELTVATRNTRDFERAGVKCWTLFCDLLIALPFLDHRHLFSHQRSGACMILLLFRLPTIG